jgi:hypothetical protein
MSHIFISYSHKDSKYVERLEKKLIEEGFNVWIDHRIDYGSQWPKAIQNSLDACDVFIVVVTENSFESEWVQNEVARAKRKRKPFFPLLLQGDPWLSIEATQYVDVQGEILPSEKFYQRLSEATSRAKKNLDEDVIPAKQVSPDLFLVENIKSISIPDKTNMPVKNIPGLTNVDTIVFGIICETSKDMGSDWLSVDQFKDRVFGLGISEDDLYDSVEILASNYFIQGTRTLDSRGLDFFQITPVGFETYAENFLSYFNELVNQVLLSIVNLEMDSNEKISSYLHQPKVLIEYVLDILSLQKLIKTTKTLGGHVSVDEITVRGKRAAKELIEE